MSDFRVKPDRGKRAPIESNPWWWNPSRPGVRGGPAWFEAKLVEIDPNLGISWNSYKERHQIWVRAPHRMKNALAQGWLLLFTVENSDKSYAPLDERTLAKIYEISADKWGNARSYFNRVVDEMDRDRLKAEAAHKDELDYISGDYYDHLQPHVGYGRSNGSKMANRG